MQKRGEFDLLLKTPNQELKILNFEYLIPMESNITKKELEIINKIIGTFDIEEIDYMDDLSNNIYDLVANNFEDLQIKNVSPSLVASFNRTYIINKEFYDSKLEFGVYDKKKGVNLIKGYNDFRNQQKISQYSLESQSNQLLNSDLISLNSAIGYHLEPRKNPFSRIPIKNLYESFERYIEKIENEIIEKSGIDLPIEDLVSIEGVLDSFGDKYRYDKDTGNFIINVDSKSDILLWVNIDKEYEEFVNKLNYATLLNKSNNESYRLGVNIKDYKSNDDYHYENKLFSAIKHIINNGKKPRNKKKSKLKI